MAKSILTSSQKNILQLLSKDSIFQHTFYFTGGTALAEYYLHHRYSEDLDFFSEEEIDFIWLTSVANKIKEVTNADKLDIQQSFNRNLVYFHYKEEVLKTKFTYFPFSRINTKNNVDNIFLDSLEDIAVNKFFIIYQKPSARHFIDLYLILEHSDLSWDYLKKQARVKFDTVIDPLQLGSQLVVAETITDLPRMIIKLDSNIWRTFFY